MNTHTLNTYRILSIGTGSYITPVDINMRGGIYGWMRSGGNCTKMRGSGTRMTINIRLGASERKRRTWVIAAEPGSARSGLAAAHQETRR